MIYFDCASTIAPYPEALQTFVKVSTEDFANASSNHALGYASDTLLEKARAQVARYFGVKADEVIFDSGASEGNNLAIKGVAYHNRSWGKKLITTQAEHPSVLQVFHELEKEGFQVIYLSYDKEGNLDFDTLEKELDPSTSLVSVMKVNNEVGYVFDTERIHRLIQEKRLRTLLHVDATQAVGKMPLDPSGYDLLTFSGHKIGSVKGSGALIKKESVQLDPQILGGSQENGFRAGTSTVPEDAALATALRLTMNSMPERIENARKLNAALRKGLAEIGEVEILTPENGSPFVLNFALHKHKGSVVAEALSNAGVYVSTKSACSAREPGKSYVLSHAGYSDDIASNAIRLSFSGTEDLSEAASFLSTLNDVLSSLKER